MGPRPCSLESVVLKQWEEGGMAALELQANLKDLEQAQQSQEGGKNGVCYGGSWRVTLKCV